MSETLAPRQTVTFTLTKAPRRASLRKTILRLMRMQPDIQRGLRRLAKRRLRHDNTEHPRGGRLWTTRVRATRLVHLKPGASFTLTITPQIMPDLQSVEPYLSAKRAT
jgi:hypothetical protein